jgi:hypothetical protein
MNIPAGMDIVPPNQALLGHTVAAGLPPRKRLPYLRACGARRIPGWDAFSVITLVHRNFRSGEACTIKLSPGQEIRTAQGVINDIRWRLDFEDPSEPVIKNGTAKVIRLNDGEIAFEHDPPTIRYGYVLVRPDGIVDIVGDLTLWRSEELPEHLRDVTTPGHHVFDARRAAGR